MSQTEQHDLRRGYLNALGVVGIWASFIVFSRMSGTSTLTAYDVIGLRYITALFVIIPLWLYYRTPLFEWRKLVLTLIGAVGFTLFAFNGFRHAPANHAAMLLQGAMPFSVAIITYVLSGELPNRQRLTGLALIAIGIGAMAFDSFHATSSTMLGDGLLVGAGLCWATYTVLLRRWHYKPMDATIAVTLLAAIIYLPFYIAFLPKNLAASPWSELVAYGVFQGILVAIIQMIFYTRAVYFLGATRFSMLASIVPVLASLGAVPILGEPLTVFIIIGLFFTCAGAWMGNRVKRNYTCSE